MIEYSRAQLACLHTWLWRPPGGPRTTALIGCSDLLETNSCATAVAEAANPLDHAIGSNDPGERKTAQTTTGIPWYFS